jgi:hypothetical protein
MKNKPSNPTTKEENTVENESRISLALIGAMPIFDICAALANGEMTVQQAETALCQFENINMTMVKFVVSQLPLEAWTVLDRPSYNGVCVCTEFFFTDWETVGYLDENGDLERIHMFRVKEVRFMDEIMRILKQ